MAISGIDVDGLVRRDQSAFHAQPSFVSRPCARAAAPAPRSPMAVAALKLKPKLKTFHAIVHVTRVEEWCVEAETAEDARELLAAGAGYRCQIGDCLNLEIERVED